MLVCILPGFQLPIWARSSIRESYGSFQSAQTLRKNISNTGNITGNICVAADWRKLHKQSTLWPSYFFCTASYSLKAAALLHINKSVSFHSWRMPETEDKKTTTRQSCIPSEKRKKKSHQSTPSSIANGGSACDGKVLSCKPRGIVGLQDRESPCLSYNMWILANILLT